MKGMLRYAGLAAAALFVALQLVGMRDFVRSPRTGIQHSNLVVRSVERDGPNASSGILPGDRILRVDGARVRNVNHYEWLLTADRSFAPLPFDLARGDSIFTTEVRRAPQPIGRVSERLSMTIVGLTYVLVGLVVAWKRPDILGSLFAASCYIFSFLVTARPVTSSPLSHIAGELGYDFLFIFLPAFFLHLFLVFPGRELVRGSRSAAVARYLYLPPAVLSLLTFALALRRYGDPAGAAPGGAVSALNTLTALYWVAYVAGSVAVFIRTYVVSGRVQRIKFRIAIVGVVLGIVPITALILLKQLSPAAIVPPRYLWPLSLSCMSISFAYAILKHDAFDMRIVARKSLVYAMLLAFALAVYFAFTRVLGSAPGRGLGLPPSVVTAAVIALIALATVPARAGLQRVVDRMLGRRTILTDSVVSFTRRIQFLTSLEDVAVFVAREIRDLLRAEQAHLFLLDESGRFTLRASAPGGAGLPFTSLAPETGIVALLREERVPLLLEYFDRLWITGNLDRISQELVALAQAGAVSPLIEQERLLGFVIAGRKISGKPYARDDAEILEIVSERSAVALTNIRLCRDSIEKERLEKEVRLASEIQNRLLPAASPLLEGASLRGRLANSREVGGDFYDYLELEPGVAGIGVADVSGKGIPAALLMTTLQASFRAEALKSRSPAAIVSALNASLYERSDPESFATFFYAIYEDRNGILRYSNGGSYPPFILSREGRISRLHHGGVLIGVEPRSEYREGIVKLREGDLLVIYTDGCIDQENERGEPYGEERLLEFFRNNLQLSVDAMIERLFAAIVAFGQNNLKDDMTVVLLRRNIS